MIFLRSYLKWSAYVQSELGINNIQVALIICVILDNKLVPYYKRALQQTDLKQMRWPFYIEYRVMRVIAFRDRESQ